MIFSQGRKWHQGSEAYGKVWQKTDVIGCMLDMTDKTISKNSFVFQRLYLLCFYMDFSHLPRCRTLVFLRNDVQNRYLMSLKSLLNRKDVFISNNYIHLKSSLCVFIIWAPVSVCTSSNFQRHLESWLCECSLVNYIGLAMFYCMYVPYAYVYTNDSDCR